MDDRVAEIKSEAEMQVHLHASRPQHIEEDLYNVRAAELVAHKRWVARHVAGVKDKLLQEKYVEEMNPVTLTRYYIRGVILVRIVNESFFAFSSALLSFAVFSSW